MRKLRPQQKWYLIIKQTVQADGGPNFPLFIVVIVWLNRSTWRTTTSCFSFKIIMSIIIVQVFNVVFEPLAGVHRAPLIREESIQFRRINRYLSIRDVFLSIPFSLLHFVVGERPQRTQIRTWRKRRRSRRRWSKRPENSIYTNSETVFHGWLRWVN